MARWPEPTPEEAWEARAVLDFSLVMDIVRAFRNLRAEKNVTPGRRIPATLVSRSSQDILKGQAMTIANLAYLDQKALSIKETLSEKPEGNIALVVGSVEIYLPLAGLVNVEDEQQRLQKELSEIEKQIQRLELLMAGDFARKAPSAVVDKERQKLATYRETATKLRRQLNDLGTIG